MNIYAAGGISQWWRTKLADRWANHNVINPFTSSNQQSVATFTVDDLASVRSSDLIIGVHDYHVYGGLALEFGYAYANGIPIVYVCLQPRVDSMMAGVAAAVFTDFHAATEWTEKKWKLQ